MTKWVTIKVFFNMTEAYLYKTRLESAKILCFIRDEHISNFYPVLTHGISLQVPEGDVDEALEIIKNFGVA